MGQESLGPLPPARGVSVGCCEKGLSLVVELLADSHTGRDFVLDVDDARREDLRELRRHIRVLDGLRERGEHRLGELTRGFYRPDARVLAELLGDVVNEVLAVRELTVGSDSHGVLVHTRC